MLGGCAQFKSKPPDKYVYVTVKETYLIDRVAAVSNRTGTVSNGEKLTVLDHARNYVKVRTPEGAVGWIREKAVATEQTPMRSRRWPKTMRRDPTVGNATVRDDVYMHVAPGRDTERFVLLSEGEKLQLLARATLPKVTATTAAFVRRRAAKGAGGEGCRLLRRRSRAMRLPRRLR